MPGFDVRCRRARGKSAAAAFAVTTISEVHVCDAGGPPRQLRRPGREEDGKEAGGNLERQGCSNSSARRRCVEVREGVLALESLGAGREIMALGKWRVQAVGWAGLGWRERQATNTRCEAVTPAVTHPIKLPLPSTVAPPPTTVTLAPSPLHFGARLYPSTLYARPAAESCVIRRAQPHCKPPAIGRSRYPATARTIIIGCHDPATEGGPPPPRDWAREV